MAKSFRLSIINRYNSQKGVRYVNKRLLDLKKKSSFFKNKFVLYLAKVLFAAGLQRSYGVVPAVRGRGTVLYAGGG